MLPGIDAVPYPARGSLHREAHVPDTLTQPRDVSLPRAYALVRCGEVNSALDEAERLAWEGAEEGTLLWARRSDDVERYGIEGQAQAGNLYCALILRPEDPLPIASQLGLVTTVALSHAIANVVSPMTELHYAWPSRMLLNQGHAAAVAVTASSQSGVPEWLVVGAAANLRPARGDDTFHTASLTREGGVPDASDALLLEHFWRQLLSWLDRWAKDGFAPIRRAWLARAWELNRLLEWKDCRGSLRGTFADLDSEGALVLEPTPGGQQVVPLLRGFGLES